MPFKHIDASDIPELKSCFSLHTSGFTATGHLSPLFQTQHPDFGTFHGAGLTLPNLVVANFQVYSPGSIALHEPGPGPTSGSIDINFVLEGTVTGKFNSMGHEFRMKPGVHNLKYTPAEKSLHEINSQQKITMVAISIEKNYFRNLIGCNDHWSEMVQNKLEKDEPFFGSDHFLTTSPRMQALLDTLTQATRSPRSRLHTHALITELLALQVEQISSQSHSPKAIPHEITAADVEKLYQVKQYIDARFLEDLSLTGLCRMSGLNEFKLKKGFRTLFKTSVIQYLRKQRLEYAQRLLCDHRKSIEEVSGILGYQYPNHFSVAYKKHFGITPARHAHT